MVSWPAVMCLYGDSELVYLAGDNAWLQYGHAHKAVSHPNDCLIDSNGKVFLVAVNDGSPVLVAEPRQTDIVEFSALINAHHAAFGQCCVAKAIYPSIAAAIGSIAA